MIFTPYKDELNRIEKLNHFNNSEYTLIRVSMTMIDKNIIDANKLFKRMLFNSKILNYDDLSLGGEYGKRCSGKIYNHNNFEKVICNLYKVANKRGDSRFSISTIKKLKEKNILNENDMLYITTVEDNLIIINISRKLPDDYQLKSIFGDNDIITASDKLINLIKIIAQNGFHPNCHGLGKFTPHDAGDTLESLLNIKTNNNKNADFEGLIEIKTKTSTNLSTLFTQRPKFEETPISKIESNDRSRVSAYTRYYGYDDEKSHPDSKRLYITIGTENNNKNGYGFFLKINEDQEKIELWAPNPKNGIPEYSAYWDFDDVRKQLEIKHPATLWVNATSKTKDDLVYFSYTSATLTLSAQFTTFLTLIKSGIITYDWRGSVSKTGKYSGRNHGNAWRINPKMQNVLFSKQETISLV